MALTSSVIDTSPFEGQQMGTSGLRKKVKVFMQKNYTENFVQSILNALEGELEGSSLIVGGDARYYNKQVVHLIIKIAAANGVAKLIIGQRGILSTPAVSSLIRSNKVLGGIILTASHNPGGIHNDFGIKFNVRNGGPAPDHFTDRVYQLSQKISTYKIVPNLDCEIDKPGEQTFQVDGKKFVVNVIESTENYVELMKSIFDFGVLRELVQGLNGRKKCNVLIDSMNGVTGIYVRQIFIDELGALEKNCRRIIPLDNFGEIHPDPNLTYAKELVDAVKADDSYDLGAAFDGDGDRNMILGRNGFFVSPSDSLAVIASNLGCIPYFVKNPVKGFARSMPTSGAIDRVAANLNQELFEVPTGWKYFSNLMDAGRLSLCGEESFGTGSNHIREKDGIWAVLAWLSIMAHKNMSIEDILKEHWAKYGRNYYTRYDYEECDNEGANKMMSHLEDAISKKQLIGEKYDNTYVVENMDNFSYTDPIDQSVAKNQGIRILFKCKSRIIFRLSGTGSSGATIRMYIEKYEKEDILGDPQTLMKPLIEAGLQISKLEKFTGRKEPTVIT